MLDKLTIDLKNLSDVKKACLYMRFFKTGKGEYGEGDQFLGITVPNTRAVAKKYKKISLNDLQKLLESKIHEYRLCALMILRTQYETAKTHKEKKMIVNFYLKNTKNINNWDLVDLSCAYIIGNWLVDKDRKILYTLAKSEDLWERRIAIISTAWFIRENQLDDTLKISKMLLPDQHDLIHKAVGWMLRELGKRDQKKLEEFLEKNIRKMPRTMLRYAIEKFDEKKRKYYLKLT